MPGFLIGQIEIQKSKPKRNSIGSSIEFFVSKSIARENSDLPKVENHFKRAKASHLQDYGTYHRLITVCFLLVFSAALQSYHVAFLSLKSTTLILCGESR